MRILTEGTWLKEHLQEVTVVDVRPREEYDKGHIPGAIHFDIWEYHWFDTTPAGMRKFDEWMAEGLRGAGLDPDRTTVVYEGYSGMLAARLVWVLHYFAFREPLLLDGGLREWLRCGYDLSTDPATLSKWEGPPYRTSPELLATVDFVHLNLAAPGGRVVASVQHPPSSPSPAGGEGTGGETSPRFSPSPSTGEGQGGGECLQVIDCRTADEYLGKQVRADRGGHVPSATNVEWKRNLTSDGYFLPPSELKALYSAAGFEPGGEIITYCHGGYRSAHTFLALWLIGFDRVRNYIGSWGEWGNRADLPLEI